MGWDTGLKNIRENTVITAQYRKKKCTVIFVDWDNTSLNKKDRSSINGQMQMEKK